MVLIICNEFIILMSNLFYRCS